MKKLLFLGVFFALILILGAGCKKKEAPVVPPPPPPPPKVEISISQFILSLADDPAVINLKEGESVILPIPKEVNSAFASAFVKKLKSNPTYAELSGYLSKGPLTVVWAGKLGSHLLIRNSADLKENYKSYEKFLLLDPIPEYSVSIGNKEVWIGKDGKFWKML